MVNERLTKRFHGGTRLLRTSWRDRLESIYVLPASTGDTPMHMRTASIMTATALALVFSAAPALAGPVVRSYALRVG